jgi:hypothetical protein
VDRQLERFSPWALRALWLVVGVAGSSTLDAALDDHGRRGVVVVQLLAGAGWITVAAALFFLSVPTLTVVRSLVPLAVPATVAVWIGGGEDTTSAVTLAAALLSVAVAFLPDLGKAFVQASAYGEEDRHLLRPPAGYLAAATLSWLLTAAGIVAGAILLGAERWVVGTAITAVAAVIGAWSVRRWHRLARRWLVIVPAGLVVHDHLVLAETLMLRRTVIAGIGLAPADTRAADLTGPAGGHALEVTTTEPVTAIYAGTPSNPGGTAIHLSACLVAPTRPGRALASAMRRS